MIELARMLVMPICPKCGNPALFERHASTPDELVIVRCDRCDWEGFSRQSVPQPKVIIETHG